MRSLKNKKAHIQKAAVQDQLAILEAAETGTTVACPTPGCGAPFGVKKVGGLFLDREYQKKLQQFFQREYRKNLESTKDKYEKELVQEKLVKKISALAVTIENVVIERPIPKKKIGADQEDIEKKKAK